MLRKCENLFPGLLGVTVVLVNVPTEALVYVHIGSVSRVTYMASHG
jgi:hypothetical protein